MKQADFLGWGGLFVAVVAMVAAVRDQSLAFELLAGLFLLISIAMIWWFQRARPNYSIVELQKCLVIADSAGKQATLTRTETFIPNFSNIEQVWCRNIASDGKIANITVDGVPAKKIIVEAGNYSIGHEFPQPLQKGKRVTLVISYELLDSFTQPRESLIHDVAVDTKTLVLKVELPRACTIARAFVTIAGAPARSLEDPDISEGRKKLRIEVKKPTAGCSYHLQWEW